MRFKHSLIIILFITLNIVRVSVIQGQEIARLEIPVFKSDQALQFPWAGGLNAPQVAPVYLNSDNQIDVLVFDRIGEVALPFLNKAISGEIGYEYAPEYIDSIPPLNGWVIIKDYDKDGLEDYFTSSQSISGVFGVAVYHAVEIDGRVEYEQLTFDQKNYLVVPTSNSTTNLYVSWEDIPAIEDVDNDGDLDVISFDPGGGFISYYRNFSVENGWGLDSLSFDIEDFCWGKVLESELSEELFLSNDPNICSNGMLQGDPVLNTRHSGSTIMLFDQDQDGDFDALIGDISSRSIVFVKNGGTPDNAWITEQDANWPSYNISLDNPYFNAAFQADINNDGHLDMLAGVNSRSFAEDVDVLWYYRNKGQLPDQQYELVQKNLFTDEMLDFGSETNPAFADMNADGLLDMVIGAFTSDQEVQSRVPALHLYLNTGTAVAPAFTLVDDDYLGMSQYSALPTWGLAPALGDLDKDGDVDLVVGEFNGQLFYFQNDAGPGQPISFQDVQFPFLGIDVGSASAPTIFDVNLDGMNDLVVGERNSNFSASGNCGSLNYFQNSGTTGSAFFDSDETNFPNTACFGNVILNDIPGLPVFAKPFLIRTEVGTMLLIGSDEGGIQVYRDIENQMYGTFTLENEDYAQIRDGFKTSLALADLNNNGYFECVVGNRRGGVSAYQTDLKNMTTSISVHQKELLGINISPNPASDIVNISALTDNPILSVDLYDLRGMSILQNLDFTGNQISLSAFAQGMYLLSVETSRGRLVKKLTISR